MYPLYGDRSGDVEATTWKLDALGISCACQQPQSQASTNSVYTDTVR